MITASSLVGFLLVSLSAVLLAFHWQHWRRQPSQSNKTTQNEFTSRQLMRRSFASSLLGVLGVALAIFEVLPHEPRLILAYLLMLLLITGWILCLGVIDYFSTQRFYLSDEMIDRIAQETQKSELASLLQKKMKP